MRARNQTTLEGRLAEFEQQQEAELDQTAKLGFWKAGCSELEAEGIWPAHELPLPNGALSVAAAKEAAGRTKHHLSNQILGKRPKPQGLNSTSTTHSCDPVGVRSISKDRARFLAKKAVNHQTGDVGHHINSFHAKPAAKIREEMSNMECNSTDRSDTDRRRKKIFLPPSSIGRSRPRRNTTRPDYRIRTIAEAEFESEKDTQQKPSSIAYLWSSPTSPVPNDFYSQLRAPKFIPFLCEWKGCQAELINLAKLRRHMSVVHGREARIKLRCKWGECGRREEGEIANSVVFATMGGLDHHMESRHMVNVMWESGDGPKNDRVIDPVHNLPKLPDYLFWNGVQVTPSLKDQRIATAAEERTRLKRLEKALEVPAERLRENEPFSSEMGEEDEEEDDN